MKAKYTAITFLTLLSIGITLATLFTPATAEIKVRISIKPKVYDYCGALPYPYWNVTIVGVDPGLINPATIALTGETGGRTIYPVAWEVSYAGRDDFIACFDPNDMKALLGDLLILHSIYGIPGRYKFRLVLTGNLYDGTAFRGVGTITLIVPDSPA